MKFLQILAIVVIFFLFIMAILGIASSFYNIIYSKSIFTRVVGGSYLFVAIIYIKMLWRELILFIDMEK